MSFPIIAPQRNEADPTLLKNPFVCNTKAQIRLSHDKDPRRFKGDTQLAHKVELSNGNTLLHNPTDEKAFASSLTRSYKTLQQQPAQLVSSYKLFLSLLIHH